MFSSITFKVGYRKANTQQLERKGEISNENRYESRR